MKILLVDNNESFRKSLKLFLENECNYQVTGEMSDEAAFLMAEIIDADIVLMNINMPGINGFMAVKKRLWHDTQLKIIAISQHQCDIDLELLIGAGFKGFVSKIRLYDDLKQAIEKVSRGLLSFPAEIKIRGNGKFMK